MKQTSLAIAFTLTTAMPSFAQEPATAETVLATVNGTQITLGHVVSLVSGLPADYDGAPVDRLYQGVLDQLIQQTLLEQSTEVSAKKLQLALDNERRAYVSSQALSKISETAGSEDAIEKAYEEKLATATPTPEYQASHILLETEEEANAVLKMLEDGGDFAELAKEKSTGPSGPSGGDLGWFGRGAMVPEFDAAVAEMTVGEFVGPVKTQFGYHLIRLNDQRDFAPLDQMREQLQQELIGKAIEKTINDLQESATIEKTEPTFDLSEIRNSKLLD